MSPVLPPAPSPAIAVMLPRDLPAEQFVPYARRAEELGFDEIWVVEDCFFRGGIAQAAVVLGATSTIRVGIGILPAAARNPVFATLEVATLAELFPGRLQVGVGHGMPGWMRQGGIWPASPLTMLAESLDLMRGLLHGATATVSGRYTSADAVSLAGAPATAPPILAGVRGPKSLALAGAAADGVVLAEPVTPEYLAEAIGALDAGPASTEATRGFPGLRPALGTRHVVVYNVAAVNADPAAARAAARPALEWIGDPDWAPHIRVLPFAAEFAALRATSTSRADFARDLPDAWVDQLAVVGTAASARRRIDELHAAGATSVVLIPAGDDPVNALESLAAVLSAQAASA
ncbi:LLM class flavin-dependent oxidoreductase [Cryobacterium sp. SO2]|uniref:LLM class flavin-dependent oxidoreductase n=1 Tax=Cryobacterium sp. SO2 TaxID=1897060 RepID=UPI00223DC076|nr:LLM class flavin-dependent oxidoreductase [Cryobacterium sp. SO2]WEO75868.1 LLM class flavin-dependent oxidoreductase [Cryobacterium sp. SO2]